MRSTINEFNECLKYIKKSQDIYSHLLNIIRIPSDEISDLLRAEIVDIVSAMDRFVHEIVRIGILNAFDNPDCMTQKCKSMPLTVSTINEIIRCSSISCPTKREDTKKYWLEIEIIEKLKTMSFQKADKIKDALSYFWGEEHKLQVIIENMSYPLDGLPSINEKQKFVEEKMNLLIERRNGIVHEADMTLTGKNKIDVILVNDAISFIKDFVYAIYQSITHDGEFERL